MLAWEKQTCKRVKQEDRVHFTFFPEIRQSVQRVRNRRSIQISKRVIQEDHVHQNSVFPGEHLARQLDILTHSTQNISNPKNYYIVFTLQSLFAARINQAKITDMNVMFQNLHNVHAFKTGFNITADS